MGTIYVDLEMALYIHQDSIDTWGGSHGIRDMGLLDSALSRPQSGYYKDIIEEAAVLLESISGNHPFVDGNKRTAIGVTDVFLRSNKKPLLCDPQVTFDFVTDAYDNGTLNKARIEAFLRANT